MPVIGLSFHTIEAKRSKIPIKGEISVNLNPKITDVKEASMPFSDKKSLIVSFDFTTTYSNDHGSLKMSGDLIYLTDKAADLLAQWKKDKTLPEPISFEINDFFYSKCLLRMASLADDLQLPLPFPFRVRKAGEEQKE